MTDSPFPPGAQLRAYLRDSGGAHQNTSVDQQESAIVGWCAERGYQLTHIYKDVATSAKNGLVGRDAFRQMVEYFDGDGRPEKGLVLWDLTRWAREVRSGLRSFLDLEARGIRIYPISEPLPTGPFGLVYVLLKFVSAEDENRRKGVDIRRGQQRLVIEHRGMPSSTQVPTGYRRTPVEIGQYRDGKPHMISRLEPDPVTAPLVRTAFELAAQGYSLIEIREATGICSDAAAVGRILANPIYGTGAWTYAGVTNPNFAEPLIGPDLWQATQAARLAARQLHPREVRSFYMLSGLIKCGNCGGPMRGSRSAGKWRYYICSRSASGKCRKEVIAADHLEGRVIARLREALENPGLLAALHAQQVQTKPHDDHAERIKAKQAELDELTSKIGRAVDALTDRPKSPALLARLDELEAAQAKAQADLAQLVASKPPDPISLSSLDALRIALLARLDRTDERALQLTLRSVECRVSVRRTGRNDSQAYSGQVAFNLGVYLMADLP